MFYDAIAMVENSEIITLSFNGNGSYYYYRGNQTALRGNDNIGFRSRFRVQLKRKIDIKEPRVTSTHTFGRDLYRYLY